MAAVFTTSLGWSMAIATLLARRGLDTPLRAFAGCAVLVAAVSFAPFLLSRSVRDDGARSWLIPVVALGVLLIPVAGLVVPAVPTVLVVALALIGGVRAWPDVRAIAVREWLVVLATVAVAAAYLFGQLSTRQNWHALSPEFALVGIAHQDTYFHAAIANMIEHQRAITTGLDGLVPLHYHVASHAWMAGLARSTGAPVILVFTAALPIVVLPALLLALVLAAVVLDRGRRLSPLGGVVGSLGLVVALDVVGFALYPFSTSHAFGLIVVLASVPVLLDVSVGPRGRGNGARLGALLALVFIASAVKLSAGGVLAATAVVVVVRSAPRVPRTWVFAIATIAVVGAASLRFRDGSGVGRLRPGVLQFLRLYPASTISTMVPPAVFIVGALLLRGRKDVVRARAGELVAVALMVSAGPAMLLAFPAEGALYFLEVATWLSLPLVVGLVAELAGEVSAPARLGTAGVAAAALLVPLADGWLLPRIDDRRRTLHERIAAETGSAAFSALDRTFGALTLAAVRTATAPGRPGVLVPPSHQRFWTYTASCAAQPFFVPALAALPMVRGLPPAEAACPLTYYGYGNYGETSRTADLDDDAACAAARERGLSAVVVVRSSSPPVRRECRG